MGREGGKSCNKFFVHSLLFKIYHNHYHQHFHTIKCCGKFIGISLSELKMEPLSSASPSRKTLATEIVKEMLTWLMTMSTSSLIIKHILTTIVFLTLK